MDVVNGGGYFKLINVKENSAGNIYIDAYVLIKECDNAKAEDMMRQLHEVAT